MHWLWVGLYALVALWVGLLVWQNNPQVSWPLALLAAVVSSLLLTGMLYALALGVGFALQLASGKAQLSRLNWRGFLRSFVPVFVLMCAISLLTYWTNPPGKYANSNLEASLYALLYTLGLMATLYGMRQLWRRLRP